MPTFAAEPFSSFVELAEARYGRMLYPVADKYVGRSIKECGEYSQGEVDIFNLLVPKGGVVLDIGAHTLPLAQMVGPAGVIFAFEPQPILHQMLCANLSLNSVSNAVTYSMALAERPGLAKIPILNYGKPFNFGGVSLDMVDEGETVPVETLDRFNLKRIDFIKLDVEGFEAKVIEGAVATLKRCRPMLYVENDRPEKSPHLIRLLMNQGYHLWWHATPLFSSSNFRGNPENPFGDLTSYNMVVVPEECPCPVEGLRPVKGAQDWWE